MSNSYNGWPAILSSPDPRLTVIEPVPNRKFRVRAGDVATVFEHLIKRFHAEVEPIDQGILDDWSYHYRAVRGGSTLSNHASATAVDLNATRHPFETKATANFSGAQIAAIRRILADMNQDAEVIRWLDGHDPMHFEINYISRGGTVENVAKLAARLRGDAVPTADPLVAVTPLPSVDTVTPLKPRQVEWRNPSTDFVRIVQRIVGVNPTGYYGTVTKRRVSALQANLGVEADGQFGAGTAEAYLLSQPNMHVGSSGLHEPAVMLLQWIVRSKVDGDFGPLTEADLKQAQAWAGLTPDGNAGADTKRAITF